MGSYVFMSDQPELIHKKDLNNTSGGYKASKFVKKFGKCLRPDLVPKYKKPFKNSTESEAAEARHAVRLRKRGYAVWQN